MTSARESEHSSDRRTEILDIAAKLFAARGYAATTVRDIAEEAGILSGSLYHHFTSKEVILSEILRGFLDRLVTDFEQIVVPGGAPDEVFDRLVFHSFQTIARKSDAVALYQNESTRLSEQPGFEFVNERSQQIEKIWLDQLEAGQRAGVFHESLDVHTVYRFLRDALWATVRWYRPGGGLTADDLSSAFLALTHRGLLSH